MNLILFLIGITLVFIFFRFVRNSSKGSHSTANSNIPLTIQNVEVGGVIILRGIGEQIEDFDFVVSAKHDYDEDGYRWFELEGMRGSEKVFLEIDDDDELSVALYSKTLNLADVGIDPEGLASIEKKDAGSISYNGITYEYEDWGEADFYKDGIWLKPQKFKYWEFEAGDKGLAIERWGRGEYKAYPCEFLRPSQYEVFALKA